MKSSMIANQWPVIKSEDFIERGDLVFDIYDIINAKINSYAIINEDGIGKSSLLNYINFWDVREELLLESSKNTTLIVKTDKPNPKSAADFFETLRRCLKDEIKYNLYLSEPIRNGCNEIFNEYKDYYDEEKIKECLYGIFRYLFNYRVATFFLIDDFDKMVYNIKEHQKKEMAIENYSFIRDIAYNPSLYNVHYIVTSRVEIQKISKRVDVSGLPGIFTPKYIDLLNKEEVSSYIDKAFNRSNIIINQEERELLHEISGGFPVILRSACESLYDWKIEDNNKDKSIDRVKLLKELVDKNDSTLETHWKYSSIEEKKLFKNIANSTEIEKLSKDDKDTAIGTAIKRKILREYGKFTAKAFQYYVANIAKLEEVVDTPPSNINDNSNTPIKENLYKYLYEEQKQIIKDKQEIVEGYRNLNAIYFNELNNIIKTDTKLNAYQNKPLSMNEKSQYNDYVVDMTSDYFKDISLDIDDIDSLKNMAIKKVWEKLDNATKQSIAEAEKLNSIFCTTDYDQSPAGNPYVTLFESLIKQKAFPAMKKYISEKYPTLKIKPNQFAKEAILLKHHPEPMIGNFKHILIAYKNEIQSMSNAHRASQEDALIKIYTGDFRTKLNTIHRLRNDISHEKKTEADKVTVEDIKNLRENMLGGNVSCIEYLIRLSEI